MLDLDQTTKSLREGRRPEVIEVNAARKEADAIA
jgi:hypothetical protein